MFLNEKVVDQFLCHQHNLNLLFKFDKYNIYITPNKSHFLVTVEYNTNIMEYQDWFNTWEEAIAKFESLCSKYLIQTIKKLEKEN